MTNLILKCTLALLAVCIPATAQHSAQANRMPDSGLAQQVAQLKAQVDRLQTQITAMQATGQGGKGSSSSSAGMQMSQQPAASSMSMMNDDGMRTSNMPNADDDMEEAGAMSMPNVSSRMPMDEMGMSKMGSTSQSKPMGMMGEMSNMGTMGATRQQRSRISGSMAGMRSSRPGDPGASHLLHIGADGFFLNHAQHITLSPEQRQRLNKLRESAELKRSTATRNIAAAEQELYVLTGADQPDPVKIDAKVREIERLRSEERLAYIQAVREAANVLTEQQKQALLGTMPAMTAK